MKIHLLGSGGGVPAYHQHNTNYAIQEGFGAFSFDKPYWLVDCGPDTVRTIVDANACSNLEGILITHAHADHSGGLASLAWRLKFVEHKKIPLIAAEPVMRMIESQCIELKYVKGMNDSDLSAFYEVANDVSFASFFPVDHGIDGFPSYGIVVKLDGMQAVFSGDTVKPLDADLIRSSDIVFHDVTFKEHDGIGVHCPLSVLEKHLENNSLETVKIIAVHHGKTWFRNSSFVSLGLAGSVF